MVKNCLIVKNQNYRENSLVVIVAHPTLGRQEFLAKGAKCIGAKLTPWLQPLLLVNVWAAASKGERPILQDVQVVADFRPSYYLGLKFSLKVITLLEKAAYPLIECQDFMRSTLRLLRTVRRQRLGLEELKQLWLEFEVLLLSFLGVQPDLNAMKGQDLTTIVRNLERTIYYFLAP